MYTSFTRFVARFAVVALTFGIVAEAGAKVPCAPPEARVAYGDDYGAASITWEAPETYADGSAVDRSSLRYVLYDASNPDYPNLLVSDLKDNSYEIRVEEASTPAFVRRFAVSAVIEGEESDLTKTGEIILGKPCADPFIEEFPRGRASHVFVFDNGDARWSETDGAAFGIEPVCSGSGMLVFEADAPEESASFITENVRLGQKRQYFSFYLYADPELADGSQNPNVIEIAVRERTSKEWKTIRTIDDIHEYEAGWNRIMIPLNLYVGKTIQFRIKGICKAADAVSPILLTLLQAGTIHEDDMEISTKIDCPDYMSPDTEFTLSATVCNRGVNDASDIVAELLRNDAVVAEERIIDLKSNQKAEVSFRQTLKPIDDAVNWYRIRVSCPGDGNTENNETRDTKVTLLNQRYPVVTNLSFTTTDRGATFRWSAPDLAGYASAGKVDFEDGVSFEHTFDDWTFVDGDKLPVGGIKGVDIPGISIGVTEASYFVFDTSDPAVSSTSEYLFAHSGKKFLASLFPYDMKSECNDWAISPRLTGKAQTLSFFAKSSMIYYPEKIEVLVSKGGMDTAEFELLSTVKYIPSDAYKRYEFELPEGANYFAIRHTGCAFVLLLDDFEFATEVKPIVLKGYNIYRDRVRINQDLLVNTEFQDPDPQEMSEYLVTAVYDAGESGPSNTVIYNMSGVEYVDDTLNVWSAPGRISVSGAEGKEVRIDSVSGINIFSGIGTEPVEVDVLPGVYVVTVDGRTFRIFVK